MERDEIARTNRADFLYAEGMKIVEMPDADGAQANDQRLQAALPRFSIKNSAS
jgi:hypothetical protein